MVSWCGAGWAVVVWCRVVWWCVWGGVVGEFDEAMRAMIRDVLHEHFVHEVRQTVCATSIEWSKKIASEQRRVTVKAPPDVVPEDLEIAGFDLEVG